MDALILWGLCFGAGAILLLTAQPFGAPKQSLADRLAALRSGSEAKRGEGPRAQVFKTRVFEELVRPVVEEVGAALASLAARFGIGGESLEKKLQAAGFLERYCRETPFLPGDLRRVPGGGVRVGKHRQCFKCDHRAISFLRLAGGGWLPRPGAAAGSLPAVEGRPPASRRRREPICAWRRKTTFRIHNSPLLPFGATGGRNFFATLRDAPPG